MYTYYVERSREMCKGFVNDIKVLDTVLSGIKNDGSDFRALVLIVSENGFYYPREYPYNAVFMWVNPWKVYVVPRKCHMLSWLLGVPWPVKSYYNYLISTPPHMAGWSTTYEEINKYPVVWNGFNSTVDELYHIDPRGLTLYLQKKKLPLHLKRLSLLYAADAYFSDSPIEEEWTKGECKSLNYCLPPEF